ncbi:hypothetical protein DICPUDRAFT_76463 [Dictyostelium purpureum]|uniref:Uncharacterized protein n=1 Tax=Dictyostelium purpureum TaxID=5786 RepID=F0ZDP4_DICPU|nr:uncharacterized protein DICPUDRAFT_76463 [Dictyostelium purpureum]EGC37954.1 hypothetical protein DICPUDRAFT_76463 [Dictyostelium purpureum]|eukprot:XP_003285525.1 hypothetical protein DICPUDRAFT_76463 [Dictyostelium purpureum]
MNSDSTNSFNNSSTETVISEISFNSSYNNKDNINNKIVDDLEILSIKFFSITERLKLNNKKLQISIEDTNNISNQLLIIENDNINFEKTIKKIEVIQKQLELLTNDELKEENELKLKSQQLENELEEIIKKRNEERKYYYDRVKDFDWFIEFYTNPINIKETKNIQKLKIQQESLGYLKDLYMKIGQNETIQKRFECDYGNYKRKLKDLEENKKRKNIEIENYNDKIQKLNTGYFIFDEELLSMQNKIKGLKNSSSNQPSNTTIITKNNSINNNMNNNSINKNLNNKTNQKCSLGISKPTLPTVKQFLNNTQQHQHQHHQQQQQQHISLTLKPPIRSINTSTNYNSNNKTTNNNNNNNNNNNKGEQMVGPIQRNFNNI